MLFLIIGMVLLSGGAFVALENMSVSRRQVQANLKRAASYAVVETDDSELSKSFRERLVAPAMARFARLAVKLSPAGKRAELTRKISAGGLTVRPQTLLSIKGLFTCAGIAVLVLGVLSGAKVMLALGLLLFIGGFMGVDFWLNGRVRARREEMERALPDTLDLLTVSVEAGLGFDSAVAKVCEKMQGPLIDEFDLMAREIRVGQTRRQALHNLGDRVESTDVTTFARAIIQADELGTSLGRTLKVQADDMRIHRQLAAEEKAMKAPVKMLFPTVMFIFPAMFIVILGPAALNILDSLAKANGGG